VDTEGAALLARAVTYASAAVADVRPTALDRPTPCAAWDLGTLLAHVVASMDAVLEGLEAACVPLAPERSGATPAVDPLPAFHERAARLRCLCTGARPAHGLDRAVLVGDRVLAEGVVARVAALELAVHGWDVGRASGVTRPLPGGLAAELLGLAPGLVVPATRPGRFAAPRPVAPRARAGTRLLAFLGRDAADR
jgi:uncharacterized protein (TIGR03086 family)